MSTSRLYVGYRGKEYRISLNNKIVSTANLPEIGVSV